MLKLVANTLRFLAADAVQQANSGHPGLPMGMADVAAVLWGRYLKHDPSTPDWPDRDRFVLSGGHGSALLYALLHLSGYELSLDDLKNFRQWGSATPGHPERGHTPGVETTTGPLGQGLGNAVGMAMAERWLAARFNRNEHSVVDHRTFVFCGDGDLMEGISHESAVLAAHLGLGKLIVFFDDNGITIDGPTHLATCEDVLARFTAYGWQVDRADGHDHDDICRALDAALADKKRPSIIACRTHIGYGSPNRQDTSKAHGEPLGEDELRLAKAKLDWPADKSFYVPNEARTAMKTQADDGRAERAEWMRRLTAYSEVFGEPAQQLKRTLRGELAEGWEASLPSFEPGEMLATRAASGAVISALSAALPSFVGGSADLTPSNNTRPRGAQAITRGDFSGRYIHFGIREHGMAAALNGMALHGGVLPYAGTFLCFADYMRPALRLAAMMKLREVFVFTHDSIGLGEDGPTHQPIEHLASLRAIPGLAVMRPADAIETRAAWKAALRFDGPTALCLTRQKLPVLPAGEAGTDAAMRGAYVVRHADGAQAILLASGSELHIALQAHEALLAKGVATRVVSLPCWELFELQDQAYREQVLPAELSARVAIEAGVAQGWHRWVGSRGRVIALDHYGASAPYQQLYEHFGLTAQAVMQATQAILDR